MSAHRRAWRRLLIGCVAIIVLTAGAWVALFLSIRWRAERDYETLRHSGRWPEHIDIARILPVEDGGSSAYDAFGYELWRLHRFHGEPLENDYLVGPRLEFTCRRWFPLLERFLEDREDTTVVRLERRARPEND